MELTPYHPGLASDWDAAVERSRNGTFLFQRRYMDYHADRFTDASVMFEHKGKILGLIPQTRHGEEWRSHGGLTYGGMVLAPEATIRHVLTMSDLLSDHAASQNIVRQRVTLVPTIYHRAPCDEERYALFVANAQLVGSRVDSVIALDRRIAMDAKRRTIVRKGARTGLAIIDASSLPDYHALLTQNLADRHDTGPVHTLAEMIYLQDAFPDNITCWGCMDDGELLAGIWLFQTERCVHVQYIATSEKGRGCGALDLLIDTMIEHYIGKCAYFAFGTSNTETGLNEGLIQHKTSFGARAVTHETFLRTF